MTAIPATTYRPGKIRNRVLWVLQILLGLFFIVGAGLPKVLGAEVQVEAFDDIGFGPWFRYFVGAVEIAGGVGLMIPRLCGLAAAGLTITMVLAAATVVFLTDEPVAMALFPLALAAVFAWITYERRATITDLRSMRSR
ncbi:DoxX family protein [Nocardia sp. XZ_19_385]|uniref:DoxX family protein n=1 Tax=Nocardia sp. XZ_19_385 TaxID=2769488 RepID=UPI00188F6D14|nr:DoxX family protein [Nocardia sp. XZ_19_385]